jgi:hypothetical protein
MTATVGRIQVNRVKEGRLRLRERLELPSHRLLDETCGKMPNAHQGSDHLPLLAKFDLLLPD